MNDAPRPDPKEAARAFAARLRKMRDRQGITQAELASRSGLTPAAISQIESGGREPTFSTIVRLAGALGTSPNDLMGLEDAEQLDPSLRPLFRKVKELSKSDVDTISAFINYLDQNRKE